MEIQDSSILRSESEIMATWENLPEEPLVSVCGICFNHASYVHDFMSGVLSQITNFKFEILIHDDASTDGTKEILLSYQSKYPRLIRLLLQSKNQYSQLNPPTSFLYSEAKGKYVALCEGDDFWRDPRKLQIQVDFLEASPDYSVSCHDAIAIDKHGKVLSQSKLSDRNKKSQSKEDLMRARAKALTMSRVFRNCIDVNVPERRLVKNLDTFELAVLGLYGKCKFHPEITPAAYRHHEGGVWSTLTKEARIAENITTHYCLSLFFKRIKLYELYEYHFGVALKLSVKIKVLNLLARIRGSRSQSYEVKK